MTSQLIMNRSCAAKLKTILRLRSEPVAIKLIKEGEDYPEGHDVPESQITHCRAIMEARKGKGFNLPLGVQLCKIGISCLGMTDTPEKVINGEFYFNMGIHDSLDSAANMISKRTCVDFRTVGEIVCPLKDADFIPDVVIFVDIPERLYWFTGLYTRSTGDRVIFDTAPFQCTCHDVTAIPIMTGRPNLSLGCIGCRKKTDMGIDEMPLGVPYDLIPGMVDTLRIFDGGVLSDAKRE